jgi:hypothetical protein
LGGRDSNGRYFLHVYDDQPKYYLAYQDRPWVRTLHQAGPQEILIDRLTAESPTAKSQFGEDLQNLQIQASVTNLVNFPITLEDKETHYWCVLTRFDAFSVTLNNLWFQIHTNRVTSESEEGAYSQIVNTVGNQLGLTKPSEI